MRYIAAGTWFSFFTGVLDRAMCGQNKCELEKKRGLHLGLPEPEGGVNNQLDVDGVNPAVAVDVAVHRHF